MFEGKLVLLAEDEGEPRRLRVRRRLGPRGHAHVNIVYVVPERRRQGVDHGAAGGVRRARARAGARAPDPRRRHAERGRPRGLAAARLHRVGATADGADRAARAASERRRRVVRLAARPERRPRRRPGRRSTSTCRGSAARASPRRADRATAGSPSTHELARPRPQGPRAARLGALERDRRGGLRDQRRRRRRRPLRALRARQRGRRVPVGARSTSARCRRVTWSPSAPTRPSSRASPAPSRRRVRAVARTASSPDELPPADGASAAARRGDGPRGCRARVGSKRADPLHRRPLPLRRSRADRARREGDRLRGGRDRPRRPAGLALREERDRPRAGLRGGRGPRAAGVRGDHGVPRGALSGAAAVARRPGGARAGAPLAEALRRPARRRLLRGAARRRGARGARRSGSPSSTARSRDSRT